MDSQSCDHSGGEAGNGFYEGWGKRDIGCLSVDGWIDSRHSSDRFAFLRMLPLKVYSSDNESCRMLDLGTSSEALRPEYAGHSRELTEIPDRFILQLEVGIL